MTRIPVSPTTGSTGHRTRLYIRWVFEGSKDRSRKTHSCIFGNAVGNYDTVTNAARWNTTEASPGQFYSSALRRPLEQCIPSSFTCLHSLPGGDGAVPAIGPAVVGSGPGAHAAYIPAQAVYSMGPLPKGSLILMHNCYTGAVSPTPPTGLKAVVH